MKLELFFLRRIGTDYQLLMYNMFFYGVVHRFVKYIVSLYGYQRAISEIYSIFLFELVINYLYIVCVALFSCAAQIHIAIFFTISENISNQKGIDLMPFCLFRINCDSFSFMLTHFVHTLNYLLLVF